MKNKVISSAIWYTIGNILNKGLAFITVPIFTRLLSKSDFGDYSNYSTWTGVFASVLPLSLASSLATARYDYRDKYHTYISSILILSNTVCASVGLLFCCFIGSVEKLLSLDRKYIYLMIIYLFLSPSYTIYMEMKRLEYKYKLVLFLTLSASVLSTIFSILFTIISEDKVSGRTFGYQIPIIIVYLMIYIYLLSRLNRPNIDHWRYALSICLPLVFHTLGTTILNSSDRLMIKRFCGSEETAYYSVAYTVSMMVYIVVTSVNDSVAPWIVECMHKQDMAKMRRWISRFYDFYFLLLNLIIIISPEILFIAGGKDYYIAKHVMPPVIGSYLFILFQIMYNDALRTSKKTVYIAGVTMSASLINVVLNYIAIPVYGYIAAAYTTLISYAFIWITISILIRRLNLSAYFPNKKILFMSLVEIVIVLVSGFLYNMNTLRYLVLVIYIGLFIYYFIKNKNIIVQIVEVKK